MSSLRRGMVLESRQISHTCDNRSFVLDHISLFTSLSVLSPLSRTSFISALSAKYIPDDHDDSVIETSSQRRHDMLSPRAKAFCVEQLLRRHQDDVVKKPFPSNSFLESSGGDDRREEIRVELCHSDLWESFYRLGTEMIITKSGRRMFPPLRLRVRGTERHARYTISLDFINVDHHKYRYVYHSSKWIVSGSGEPVTDGQRYGHPDGPFSGDCLVNQIISFEKVKLTNNHCPKSGQVSIVSMQRFLPEIHVEKLGKNNSVIAHTTVSFPQTSFMAVTAYQNQEITRLKIARNPFAKGFREAGKNRSSLDAIVTSLQSYLQHKHMDSRKRTIKDVSTDDGMFVVPTKSTKLTSDVQGKVMEEIPKSWNSYTFIKYPSVVEHTPLSRRQHRLSSLFPTERKDKRPSSICSATTENSDVVTNAVVSPCWCWSLNHVGCSCRTCRQSVPRHSIDNGDLSKTFRQSTTHISSDNGDLHKPFIQSNRLHPNDNGNLPTTYRESKCHHPNNNGNLSKTSRKSNRLHSNDNGNLSSILRQSNDHHSNDNNDLTNTSKQSFPQHLSDNAILLSTFRQFPCQYPHDNGCCQWSCLPWFCSCCHQTLSLDSQYVRHQTRLDDGQLSDQEYNR